MRLLFVRHGETDKNREHRTHISGDSESLNQEGREQARKVAALCRDYGVEALFSSPERRATETAAIISSELGIDYVVLDGFRERNWGAWAGKPWEEISEALGQMTLDERYNFVPPGGESWKQMDERLGMDLQTVVSSGYTMVAVISHSGALRTLLPIIKDDPKETSFSYDFQNASVTIFDYEQDQFTEIMRNSTAHLR